MIGDIDNVGSPSGKYPPMLAEAVDELYALGGSRSSRRRITRHGRVATPRSLGRIPGAMGTGHRRTGSYDPSPVGQRYALGCKLWSRYSARLKQCRGFGFLLGDIGRDERRIRMPPAIIPARCPHSAYLRSHLHSESRVVGPAHRRIRRTMPRCARSYSQSYLGAVFWAPAKLVVIHCR